MVSHQVVCRGRPQNGGKREGAINKSTGGLVSLEMWHVTNKGSLPGGGEEGGVHW